MWVNRHYIAITEIEQETWLTAGGFTDYSDGERYVLSVYWVFTTITSVGYGDVVPANSTGAVYIRVTFEVLMRLQCLQSAYLRCSCKQQA